MREILFRGKRLDNGEWILGDLVRGSARVNPGKVYICPGLVAGQKGSYGDLMLGGFIEVDPETVGEFTGVKDANGIKIFEGDLLGPGAEELYPWKIPYVVAPSIYGGGFSYAKRVGAICWEYSELYEDEVSNMVVVGNLCDNPELLEGLV